MTFSSLSDSFGSAFTFDFVRNSARPKRPLLRDMMGSGRFGRGAESAPVECNGSKSLEMQLRLQSQSQQEELSRVLQEQSKLREELASQKVQFSHSDYFTQWNSIFKKGMHCTNMDNMNT